MTRLALLEIPQGTKAGTEHVLDNKNIASSDVVEVELGKGPEKVGLAETETQPEWHIAAPYTEPRHQLDLSTLDISNRLLALALSSLADATPAYATTPYEQAMNWPKVMTTLKLLASQSNPPLVFPKTDFYVVEFRSKLKPANEIDKEFLFRIDKESHREAAESGGLLKYWYGKPDQERHNLATCLWTSRQHAIEGGKGPWHRKAYGLIRTHYESINVKSLVLTIEEDVAGWSFRQYS